MDTLGDMLRPVVCLEFVIHGENETAGHSDFESVVIGDNCNLWPPVRSPLSPSCNAIHHGRFQWYRPYWSVSPRVSRAHPIGIDLTCTVHR